VYNIVVDIYFLKL